MLNDGFYTSFCLKCTVAHIYIIHTQIIFAIVPHEHLSPFAVKVIHGSRGAQPKLCATNELRGSTNGNVERVALVSAFSSLFFFRFRFLCSPPFFPCRLSLEFVSVSFHLTCSEAFVIVVPLVSFTKIRVLRANKSFCCFRFSCLFSCVFMPC